MANDELRNIILPRLEPGDYEELATAAIFRALKELDKDEKEISFRLVERGYGGNSGGGRDSPAHSDDRTR